MSYIEFNKIKKYLIFLFLIVLFSSCEENDSTLAGVLPASWAKVDTLTDVTCGLTKKNKLYCWGMAEFYHHSITGKSTPMRIDGEWIDFSVGDSFICGIKTDNKLYCWGRSGALGIGETQVPNEYIVSPEEVLGGFTDWVSVSAGSNHTCGIRKNKDLYCWGLNYYGEVGVKKGICEKNEDCISPEICNLDSGACEESGVIKAATRYEPVLVDSNLKWKTVEAGNEYTCGIDNNDELYCWGKNDEGQLGTGDINNRYKPEKVDSAEKWKTVALSKKNTLGILLNDNVLNWGNGTLSPVNESYENKWLQFSISEGHLCGINLESKLFCGGINLSGEIGIGKRSEVEDLTEIEGSNWKMIITGNSFIIEGVNMTEYYKGHTCGIRESNGLDRIYCWGNNDVFQLTGEQDYKTSPTLIKY